MNRYVIVAISGNDTLWSQEFATEKAAEEARRFLEQNGHKMVVIQQRGRDDDEEDEDE